MAGWLVGSLAGWLYGWMDGWMDVWMDGWLDGCCDMDRKAFVMYVRGRLDAPQQREENELAREGGDAEEKGGEERREAGRKIGGRGMHKIQMLFVIFISGAVTRTPA